MRGEEKVFIDGKETTEPIQWHGIKQHRTYACIKCHGWTRVLSYSKEPLIVPPTRCACCGFSMKEARSLTKLKKVEVLLNKAKELLQEVVRKESYEYSSCSPEM